MFFYNNDGFGKVLFELRKQRKYSLEEVSNLTGLHRHTIRSLENGKRQPKLDTLIFLSLIYKVNLFYIFQSYLHIKPITMNDFLKETMIELCKFNSERLEGMVDKFLEEKDSKSEKCFDLLETELDRQETFINFFTDFNLNKSKNINSVISEYFKYTDQESNVLNVNVPEDMIDFVSSLLLASIYRREDLFDKTEELLKGLELNIDKIFFDSKELIFAKLNLTLNFTLLYFRTDNHQKTIEHSKVGIEISLDKNEYFLYKTFLFQKAIAEKELGLEYQNTIIDLYMYLLSVNEIDQLKAYENVFKDKYPNIFKEIQNNEIISNLRILLNQRLN